MTAYDENRKKSEKVPPVEQNRCKTHGFRPTGQKFGHFHDLEAGKWFFRPFKFSTYKPKGTYE